MSDFVIRKDIYGSWWHDFNNDATKINISDFEALIDEVQNTFIIQCKNGSNVPTMGVSIANVKVINSIISPTPIAFSGAVGLKNLLTTLNYTPYVTAGSGGGAVDSVNGQTGVVIIPIPTNTSELVNDGENGTDPFITADDVPLQNLTQVLTVEDKVYKLINDTDYTFELTDRLTWNLLTPDVSNLYLDDELDSFPNFSSIVFDIYAIETELFPVGITDIRSNLGIDIATPITSVTLKKGDRCELKKTNSDIWFLQVVSYSSGGGAVDSVNGQTGVVVLDATDVGAEPTKGADDNYVTDAQLIVIGNTSGTNSGDSATNTKYDVTATTGAVISFATPQIYNSIASPSSSNITDNLTGARIGVVQKIYHNSGTAPTFPSGWVRRGTGTYVTSTLNIIYAEWSVGTTVEYWITQ